MLHSLDPMYVFTYLRIFFISAYAQAYMSLAVI